jgi:hypothetical protein
MEDRKGAGMNRRALCIGINDYPGTEMDLRGCVNDARDWSALLSERGFEVTTLLDAQASKAAMVEGLRELIGGAARGDVVVISFAGHGTCVPDLDGDELDGLDEGLCPHDIQTGAGALTDDEIHQLLGARAAGVRLVLIADSCHSGTVTRAAAPDPDADDAPRVRFLPMGNWLPPSRLPRALSGSRGLSMQAVTGRSAFSKALSRAGGDLLLAGCQEGADHFSYDASFRGRHSGAFSYYALKALKGLPADATYAQWHAAITPACLPAASYPQTPQIVGSAAAKRRRIFS